MSLQESLIGEPAIRTTGLTKRYGEIVAVDGLDLEVPLGSVVGFVGPNGAGKTTTFRMLLGLITPSSGSGEVLGHRLADKEEYLSKVGAMIEGPAFYPMLSGRRNLEILAALGGVPASRVSELLETVDLADRAKDKVSSYSLGMKQRLGIAAALLPQPKLLILDEPTNGLDPAGILEMRKLLRELGDQGTTVFVSSHLLSEVEQICDHLVMITKGRLVFQGRLDDLVGNSNQWVVARPEDSEDLSKLVALARDDGYVARTAADSLHVEAPASYAGALNRKAAQLGITLVELRAMKTSLEETFLGMTEGSTP